MGYIVIDKSFLVGVSRDRVLGISINNRIIMIQSLMDELMCDDSHDKRVERANCFGKLPDGEDPVDLLSIGRLFHHEIHTHTPATPIDRFFEKGIFEFNPGLRKPNFTPDDKSRNAFRDSRQRIRAEAEDWRRMAVFVPATFPELVDVRSGSKMPDAVQAARDRVARDPDCVRAFWSKARHPHYAAADAIDDTWATFRWIQVSLLYLIDLWWRHGPKHIATASIKKLTHDAHDLQYCLAGLLVGSIATNDQRLIIPFFRAILPEGKVILPNSVQSPLVHRTTFRQKR